ncbi:hypothetical protein D5086_032668, partial [Populus alba]
MKGNKNTLKNKWKATATAAARGGQTPLQIMVQVHEDVNHYESKAPHPKMAHPWPDHFYPLQVAMGAAGDDAEAKLVHRSWTEGGFTDNMKKQ